MAPQQPYQPDKAVDALGRVAELHPGVLSVSAIHSRHERAVAAVDATPEPQPVEPADPQQSSISGFHRMSNWLRRLMAI